MEAGGPLGEWFKMHCSPVTNSDIVYATFQFTYINLAFSPAPDDTVANLFKVCILHVLFSLWQGVLKDGTVVLDGGSSDSEL